MEFLFTSSNEHLRKNLFFFELFITNFILSTLFTLLVLSYIYILFKKYFNVICFATWVNIASWCFIENPLIVFKEIEQRLAQILLRAITIYRRSHRSCSIKKLFLKISQYSKESICVEVKRDFNTGVFLRILRNFLKTLILKNICKQLFLDLVINH